MSVADKLGTGSSFSQVPRGRSARGRAKAVTQGDVPAYELVRLHLEEVAPTPLNPRRNFGSEADLTRFGEELRQAQLAACVAVSREAYLALWPAHEQRIGQARHILVNGERRYRSAVHVGLEALDFVVRDDLAASREAFINHLLKENLEREDFDVIERARGVQQLVDICAEKSERGARSRAAEQLGKDRSWVTNQLALLELPDELQHMLSAGSLAERDGRLLSRHLKDNPGLDSAALLEHLDLSKSQKAQAKQEQRQAVEAVRAAQPAPWMEPPLLSTDNESSGRTSEQSDQASITPGLLSADNVSPEPVTTSEVAKTRQSLLSADNKPSGSEPAAEGPAKAVVAEPTRSSALPSPRPDQVISAPKPESEDGSHAKRLPYDDPFYVVSHLHIKMTDDNFVQGGRVWMALLRQQHPDAYQALLHDLIEQQERTT
ncbi:plasmid partitioning protein [Streptomyces sp. NPDC006458]|uniref:ParB/RepB/Spo0J family partition protein n=1 Tax=Streptomyces sp. NPDC006458 TaxID=3154302 RepID=UPI0033ACF0AA